MSTSEAGFLFNGQQCLGCNHIRLEFRLQNKKTGSEIDATSNLVPNLMWDRPRILLNCTRAPDELQ